jgi:hypothetical protein
MRNTPSTRSSLASRNWAYSSSVVSASVTTAVQTVPAFPSLLALLGTVVLYWIVYGYAAQVAAVFLLGDPPWRNAFTVGVIFALVNVALIRFDPLIVLPIALAADMAGFRVVYRVKYATAIILGFSHAVVAILFTVPIAYLLTLLSTAPT